MANYLGGPAMMKSPLGDNPPPKPTTSSPGMLGDQYKLYNTAVEQQAGDYSNIMGNYGKLLSDLNNKAPLVAPSSGYTAKTYDYNPTAQVTGSLNNLQSLSQSGGYNPSELADLRARGISPIRAVYAGALRDIDRNRVLKGGYSPGYAAVRAKMAREQSAQIADQMTDVNAGIAERVAQNRLSIAPAYASAAGAESGLRTNVGLANAGAENEASRFNATLPLEYAKINQQDAAQKGDIVRGMTSLYGTTPALASLYGGQAQNAASLQDRIINERNNDAINLLQAGYAKPSNLPQPSVGIPAFGMVRNTWGQ